MRPMLIGIAGGIGVGKSTVADYLWDAHGFLEMRFADRLKEATAVMFGWDRMSLEDRAFKETVDPRWGITPGVALQTMGTECVRNHFGFDFWVKAWKQVYDEVKLSQNVVVSDVRYDNEADAIRAAGGVILHLHRKELIDTSRNRAHSSEQPIMMHEADFFIRNDFCLDDLFHAVDDLIIGLRMKLVMDSGVSA